MSATYPKKRNMRDSDVLVLKPNCPPAKNTTSIPPKRTTCDILFFSCFRPTRTEDEEFNKNLVPVQSLNERTSRTDTVPSYEDNDIDEAEYDRVSRPIKSILRGSGTVSKRTELNSRRRVDFARSKEWTTLYIEHHSLFSPEEKVLCWNEKKELRRFVRDEMARRRRLGIQSKSIMIEEPDILQGELDYQV